MRPYISHGSFPFAPRQRRWELGAVVLQGICTDVAFVDSCWAAVPNPESRVAVHGEFQQRRPLGSSDPFAPTVSAGSGSLGQSVVEADEMKKDLDSARRQLGGVNCIFCGEEISFATRVNRRIGTYILRCQHCGREASYSSQEIVFIEAQTS